MKYQIMWSENIIPEFTEDDKELYKELGMQQVYPVGNTIKGRRVFHGLGDIDNINNMLNFVTEKNKEPKVICVSDINNIEYGYDKVLISKATESEEAVYEIQRNTELELYKVDDDLNKYLIQSSIKIDNETIVITPPSNCFAGWESIIN